VPVFTSSDAVFDGAAGPYSEEDPPHPILHYGRQKLAVERYIEEKAAPALVVRVAKAIGGFRRRGEMLSEWLERARKGEPILCATDQILSPVSLDDSAKALAALAIEDARGLFHIAGPCRLSRAELLDCLLECARPYLDLRPVVRHCLLREVPAAELRPRDCSMSSAKLRAALGMELQTPREICESVVASMRG